MDKIIRYSVQKSQHRSARKLYFSKYRKKIIQEKYRKNIKKIEFVWYSVTSYITLRLILFKECFILCVLQKKQQLPFLFTVSCCA